MQKYLKEVYLGQYYTCYICVIQNIKFATFADDTVVLAVEKTLEETTVNLQSAKRHKRIV